MNSFIDQLVTQIINSYNKYMNKLHDANIARSLLHKSLDLLGLEEHSDLVYDQTLSANEAKKQRFKININGFKLVNNLEENEHYLEMNKELVYSSDIYFQQRNIVETDFYTPDEAADVFYDVEFEVDAGLSTGFFEFRFFTTSPVKGNKEVSDTSRAPIEKKDQLINFSDTESIDNSNDVKSGGENLVSHYTRNSNPFETTTRAKSVTENDHKDHQDLQNFENKEAHQNLHEYQIKNEDIKLDFNSNQPSASSPTSRQKNLESSTVTLDPNSKTNNMLKSVKSPIKEENEEDECSRQNFSEGMAVLIKDPNIGTESPNNSKHDNKHKGTVSIYF
jgi:hypothetical protein